MTKLATQHELAEIARRIRVSAVQMVHASRAAHLGSCLSCADLITVLYWHTLRLRPDDPVWEGRDRFLMSKGHAAAILYSALAIRGYFPKEELAQYCTDGSRLTGHVTTGVPGVDFSTGSLGHALPVGCGLALAAKYDKADWRTFVLLSDGELDEGSNWEALLFAPHHKLDKLTAIIDFNKIQSFGRVSDVLDLQPLAHKLRAFRWNVIEIDGHDIGQVLTALDEPVQPGIPTAIIANTVKGKGVSFMEDELAWHYRSPTTEQLEDAIKQIGETE
jgi:transketolase